MDVVVLDTCDVPNKEKSMEQFDPHDVDALSLVPPISRDRHLPLREYLAGSDLLTNLEERDIIGNVDARVHLQRHLENTHHQLQQTAERRWSKLERNDLRHFHKEELYYHNKKMKEEFLNHERPGAQRIVDQDTFSQRWTRAQRPFSFGEKQLEWFRGNEKASFDYSSKIDRSVQLDRLKCMAQPRPNNIW